MRPLFPEGYKPGQRAKPKIKPLQLPILPKDNKWIRYRKRLRAKQCCPHCGKPCAPYFECEVRREYRRLKYREKVLKKIRENENELKKLKIFKIESGSGENSLNWEGYADNYEDAFRKAMKECDPKAMGIFIRINEIGKEEMWDSTERMLKKLGFKVIDKNN